MSTVPIRLKNAGIVIAVAAALVLGAAPRANADDIPDPGDVPGAVITDQPAAPQFIDPCGIADDQLVVPADLNAVAYLPDDYRVDGVGQVLVNIFTYGDNSFAAGIRTSWSHTYTDEPCETDPPVDPTTVDPTSPATPVVEVVWDGSRSLVARLVAAGIIR